MKRIRTSGLAAKSGLVAAGLVAGGVLASSLGAQAATSTPTPAATAATAPAPATGTTTPADPHPGDNGADGVPEANEAHGPGGHGLDLSGTVTAVTPSSVTITTASGTTTYAVTSASDVDKNGEATVSALVVGDAVTFSVSPSSAKQIDKLHAGDAAKDMPTAPGSSTTSGAAAA